MKLSTFKGGVHPFDGKDYAKDVPIRDILPGKEVVFPLSQHIGAPAKPVVAVGDQVLVGQVIAEAGGFVSANVHSSVSGKVKKIEPRIVVNGSRANCIIIQNDEQYNAVDNFMVERKLDEIDHDVILNSVKDAGIVGLGGAGFPTFVKLSPKDPYAIEYVIVNGAECEPYLTSDYRLMLEEGEKLIKGLEFILKLFPNAKGIIGIENNKPEAITKIQGLVVGHPNITVAPLKTKYPQGGERSLIYATTKRRIGAGMLPSDVGCIVDNVATVIAIYEAVVFQKPLIDKVMTVTGDAISNPCNLRVKMGTNYQDILKEAGGFKEQALKIISGGPMMGMCLYTLDFPMSKTSSTLLALTKDEVAEHAETHCIHCGKCVQVCPCHLVPQMMYTCASHEDVKGFEKARGDECIECGSCTFICPAKRPMTQAFKQAKKDLMAMRRGQL